MIITRSDAITLEIIQSSLEAISDEMFAALRKTAMSAIIHEVLDYGTGITDARGNIASSGAGIPAFVGVLDKAVKRVLELHPPDAIRPGDLFVTNDPFYGGVTHLNDIVLVLPVFAGDELVAWTANIAHWNDVGGLVPGSISNEASQIFQEGLRLPAVKLISEGQPKAPHLGERLPAGNFASICGTFIGGQHPDTGKHFTIVEPQIGGWGGSARRDGNSAIFSGFHGETFNCPAEVAEARYGLYVEQLALGEEPGGEGKHRGGKGIVVDYRVRSDNCFFTCAYTRNRHKPWPLQGGREGSPNCVEVIRTDGTIEEYSVITALEVNDGDLIRIHTGAGAGYGDPRRRQRELVRDDVANGYVTPALAREIYGLDD
jgi:N-methylhydantoinase B/oxoprolinase/acetone carboxylase alpha subunit